MTSRAGLPSGAVPAGADGVTEFSVGVPVDGAVELAGPDELRTEEAGGPELATAVDPDEGTGAGGSGVQADKPAASAGTDNNSPRRDRPPLT